MANTSIARILAILLVALMCAAYSHGAQSDRVLLKEIQVLTLYKERYTTGRRSSPVPQLTCVGGSAKGYFTPAVVQCYNRGSDGYDVQWECKTDMDNAYRFGSVEVTCEGYDHPDDPYILRGSCGLEYSLEFTEEGYQRYNKQKSHYHSGDQYNTKDNHVSWDKKGKSVFGDLMLLGIVVLVIYIVYKTCLSSSATPEGADDDQVPPRNTRNNPPPPYSPPPYGFRDEYMPRDSCSGSASYSGNTYTGTGANQGGGFWTGAATGGLLGYLFGRNNGYGGYTQYQQPYSPYSSGWGPNPYARPHNTGGWFSGWGSVSGGRTTYSSNTGGWGSSSSSSTGTRTASGFGGTKRR